MSNNMQVYDVKLIPTLRIVYPECAVFVIAPRDVCVRLLYEAI